MVVSALDLSDIENKVTCEIMIACCLIRGSGTLRSTLMDIKYDIGLIYLFVSVQVWSSFLPPKRVLGTSHKKYSGLIRKREGNQEGCPIAPKIIFEHFRVF